MFNENKAVALLAEIVALEYGFYPDVAAQIKTAAILHDVGKQKIPDSILNKPGKLTEREFELIKTHTLLGAEILSTLKGSLGEMARQTALYHHEWWDGNGYWGKRTDELPCYIPIVSVADVFTALVCERPYKNAWPPEEALDYIQNQTGTQFSPALARVFIPLARNDSRVKALFDGR